MNATPQEQPPAPTMKRIETVRELRQMWEAIGAALLRDLGAARRLARDPKGTLRQLGYDVAADAERALLSALPSR